MNNTEISKYIKEQIGKGIPKLEVLKTLFAQEEKKSKRKFIKREIANFPSKYLLKEKIFNFFRKFLIVILEILLGTMGARLIIGIISPRITFDIFNFILDIISIFFLAYILSLLKKNNKKGYLFGLIFFLLGTINIVYLNFLKILSQNITNIVLLLEFFIIIPFSINLFLFYKDNREWKKYVKENKI